MTASIPPSPVTGPGAPCPVPPAAPPPVPAVTPEEAQRILARVYALILGEEDPILPAGRAYFPARELPPC